MKNTFNGWSEISSFDLEKVIDLVLTNGTPDTIKSDMWLIPLIGEKNKSLSILDFGFGIGRNIFEFSQNFPNWKIYGYDNPNMINKSEEYSKIKFSKSIHDYTNIELSSEWEYIKMRKYDCIYATLVFQHILEKDINAYLSDIKLMTNRLIVSGRRFNDDSINGVYKNTWQILENNGYYPSNINDINYSVEGDPEEHITCVYDF